MTTLDLNPQFKKALSIIESGQSVFITGRAGTGKSTLLSYFRKQSKKKVIVLAPTGVAAVNISGQTIHSFFSFLPNITLQKVKKKHKDDDTKNIYKKLEILVIDEISMVRADLLDCVDKFLRLNGREKNQPFGGVQMVFIGDLYQLPPVVGREEKQLFTSHYESPYFFSSHTFAECDMAFIELEKIYRQKNEDFIKLLNSIRNKSCTEEHLAELNSRHQPTFEPDNDDFYISLTSTNDLSDILNGEKLSKLKGKKWRSQARITGTVGKEYYPAPLNLELRVDAQIMLLNNDALGRWINGTIGKVVNIRKGDGEDIVSVKLENGKFVEVAQNTWEIFKFSLKNNQIMSEIVGAFTQYPLRLAFAITIHKSQGKTFEKVIIDIGRGTFAHGQMYVALSRCVSMEGLVLRQAIQPAHIRLDYAVVKFLTKYQYDQAGKSLSLGDKIEMIKDAIKTQKTLRMVYLKGKDEKSERNIKPQYMGEMEYAGKLFLGMEAICLLRKQKRVFNVERILELKVVE